MDNYQCFSVRFGAVLSRWLSSCSSLLFSSGCGSENQHTPLRGLLLPSTEKECVSVQTTTE